MNLAMFHDWIIWERQGRYFLNDAFIKFVTAFEQDFDRITFCSRVAPAKPGTDLYPLSSARHAVCPFPYYESIYSLYTKGWSVLPRIVHIIKKNLDQWDLLWLEAPHPIGVMAAYLARKRRKPYFFLVRQNLQEQVRHRTRGVKRPVSIFLVHLLEHLSQHLSRHSLTFTVGQEMFQRYQKRGLPVFPVIISLVSEQDLKFGSFLNRRVLSDDIKLLSIGRLDPEKGLYYLIQAVKRLEREANKRVSLTLVGRGKEEPFLKREVQIQGLSEVVRLVGYIKNGPELLSLYQDHDYFIIPSLTGEGLPQTIMEAMASQIPVIATAVAGIPYFIQDQINGILIPPADSGAICRAILSLEDNDILRNKIINEGIKTVSSHTLEREQKKMMGHIRRVLLKL